LTEVCGAKFLGKGKNTSRKNVQDTGKELKMREGITSEGISTKMFNPDLRK